MSKRFPPFNELSAEQQRLLHQLTGKHQQGDVIYDNLLSDEQKAGFLNITAALAAIGINTSCLRLKPLTVDPKTRGIQQDRLLFESVGSDDLKRQLEDRFDKRMTPSHQVFIEDVPDDSEHPGMNKWGGRQWVTTCSIQIGGGLAGAFVDIDEFGVKTDLVGAIGHGFEVLRNKGFFFFRKRATNPYKIGKGLRQRGVNVGYID
jgi:hypothetical protein